MYFFISYICIIDQHLYFMFPRIVVVHFRACLWQAKHAYGVAVVLDDALYVLGGMEDMLESFKTSNLKVEEDSFNIYNS
jgi:hypothetical protein